MHSLECCHLEMRVEERKTEDGREVLVLRCPVCNREEKIFLSREQEPETPAF